MDVFLKKTSYQVDSKQLTKLRDQYHLHGSITETHTGSIRMVRRIKVHKSKSTSRKTIQALDNLLVRKTLRLEDQNCQALARVPRNTKILRGTSINDIFFQDPNKKEVGLWYSLQGRHLKAYEPHIVKVAWATQDLKTPRDQATKIFHCNEFLNEATVGHLVTKQLVPELPHFVSQHDAYIDDSYGNFILDYAGKPFESMCMDMTLDEVKSVVLQILCTLDLAAKKQAFKHHDVHLENVFVSPLRKTIWQSKDGPIDLSSKNKWTYTLLKNDGSPIQVTFDHCNWLAKLGDYGLSSITDPESQTRIQRFDYKDLDAGEVEWGPWNGNQDRHQSQDLTTFMSKFFLEDELKSLPPSIARFFQDLWAPAAMKYGLQSSSIGRPLTDWNNELPILHIADFLSEFWPEVCKHSDDALQIAQSLERSRAGLLERLRLLKVLVGRYKPRIGTDLVNKLFNGLVNVVPQLRVHEPGEHGQLDGRRTLHLLLKLIASVELVLVGKRCPMRMKDLHFVKAHVENGLELILRKILDGIRKVGVHGTLDYNLDVHAKV